jgi:hypothetical protein
MWTTGSPKEGQRQCLQDLAVSGRDQIEKVALTVTILKEDAETLLDKEVCVEDDQAEGERQNIIACSDFEEISNRILQSDQLALYSVTQTLPKIDLYSGILSRRISTGVRLTSPCICSLSKGVSSLGSITRDSGRRYVFGCTKGDS